MRRPRRAEILQGLLLGLLALGVASTAQAQVASIDFQVINLPLTIRLTDEHYVAIRTPAAWAALWPKNSKTIDGEPIPSIDFSRSILLIAQTGVKGSSGYSNVFTSVKALPASMTEVTTSNRMVTQVHIIEISPGNCPRMPELSNSIAHALIPQTTNEIRFIVTKADTNCAIPVVPPFIK
jgi:hypothetical protein